jgi:hypothetical protein
MNARQRAYMAPHLQDLTEPANYLPAADLPTTRESNGRRSSDARRTLCRGQSQTGHKGSQGSVLHYQSFPIYFRQGSPSEKI